jgi:hypothetical protein
MQTKKTAKDPLKLPSVEQPGGNEHTGVYGLGAKQSAIKDPLAMTQHATHALRIAVWLETAARDTYPCDVSFHVLLQMMWKMMPIVCAALANWPGARGQPYETSGSSRH